MLSVGLDSYATDDRDNPVGRDFSWNKWASQIFNHRSLLILNQEDDVKIASGGSTRINVQGRGSCPRINFYLISHNRSSRLKILVNDKDELRPVCDHQFPRLPWTFIKEILIGSRSIQIIKFGLWNTNFKFNLLHARQFVQAHPVLDRFPRKH